MVKTKLSPFILASSSSYRLALLKQIGFIPDLVCAPEIDESPRKGETPCHLALRLAREKGETVLKLYPDALVLAADTVPCMGRRALFKPQDVHQAEQYMRMLSGRRHRVYTGVALMNAEKTLVKYGETRLKMKRLSAEELAFFLASNEWQGKAGGYGIQGVAAAYLNWVGGDEASNVSGLPLHLSYKMLLSFGRKPQLNNLGFKEAESQK
jgi:septum formation protein